MAKKQANVETVENQVTTNEVVEENIASADTPYVSANGAIVIGTSGGIKQYAPSVDNIEDAISKANGYTTVVLYKYDPITGELLSANSLNVDKDFVTPAYHTTTKPIENKEGFAVCYNVNKLAWEYVPDYRGRVAYSTITGQKVKVYKLGVENVTDVEPVPYSKFNAETNSWVADESILEEAKKDKLKELSAYFVGAVENYSVNVEGIGLVDCGYTAYMNVLGLINQVGSGKVDFVLADNSTVKITAAKLADIRSAIEVAGINMYKKKWALRAQIQSASSVAEIIGIEFNIDPSSM